MTAFRNNSTNVQAHDPGLTATRSPTEARRIETSVAALPRALIAVANALRVVDRRRVWDATSVIAANSADGFTGEDGELVIRFQSKGQGPISN